MIGVLIALVVCIIPIAIIALIITAIGKRNKEDKSYFEDVARNIYIYIILIGTLIAIIMGVIITFRIGLDVLLPEKSLYESSYRDEEQDKNENIIELCTTFSLVIVVIPIFTYHNKLAKESRANKNKEINN